MIHVRIRTLLVAALTPALLAACANGPSKASTATVRVFVQPYLAHAPLLVADAEGYFAEQGIRVEFVRLSDPAAAIPMLINGTLDVLPSGPAPGVLNAITRGYAVRAVADKGYYRVGPCSRVNIVLRPALAEEAKGGRPRVHRISIDKQPQMRYLVERMLGSAGFQLSDLEVLYIPHLPEIEALADGKIDAAIMTDPHLTTALERGAAVPWIRMEDVLPDLQFSFLFFGPTLLRKDTDLGRRFLIAYLKAVRQLEEGKTKRNLEVLARVTEEGSEALQRMCWPAYHVDGHVDVKYVMEFQAWAMEQKLIDRIATAEEFWEPTLLVRANESLAKQARSQ